ncbi:MAG: serine/threonine protein kinase, partial [Verrucomicrobia bacterium]|nr:serine/threonine protein kinase [Verrucomicrobiota bacterium]
MAGLEGQTFAGYEVVSLLGRGGMGAVWKARHTMLNRFAALKMMAPELAADAEFVKRFKREATSAANLSHEHLVQVYSAGEFEGTHYIAMEFVEGETLRGRIERHGKLDPCEALAITTHIAEALQYAWNTAKLIHRDIKPDNIFLSNTGDVKVGDMGLAKTVGGPTTSLTQTGMMMGSPHYISPEQARGVKEIDFRADIYSLGCTLYHMLTGRPPYEGDDSLVVINKHVNAPPPAIFNVWPTCPVALAVLVGKMVAKKPHERPQSYEELIAQLREVHDKLKPAVAAPPVSAGEPTKVATPKPTPKAVKPRVESRVSRAGIAAGAVALVVLLAGLLLWSPWKKPSSQYSQTPSLQSSAADAAAALKLLGSVYTNAVGAE